MQLEEAEEEEVKKRDKGKKREEKVYPNGRFYGPIFLNKKFA